MRNDPKRLERLAYNNLILEEQIKMKSLHFNLLLKHLPVLFISIDKLLNIETALGCGLDLTNIPSVQFVDKTIYEVFNTDDALKQIIDICLAGEEVSFLIQFPNRVTFNVTGIPFINENIITRFYFIGFPVLLQAPSTALVLTVNQQMENQ